MHLITFWLRRLNCQNWINLEKNLQFFYTNFEYQFEVLKDLEIETRLFFFSTTFKKIFWENVFLPRPMAVKIGMLTDEVFRVFRNLVGLHLVIPTPPPPPNLA